MTPSAVRVRVPATSANLGPGFDSCGLALALYDDLLVEVIEVGLSIRVNGEDDGIRDERHLIVRALRAAFDVLGARPSGLALSCTNRIPHGRGLGSSAAAIVAGVSAAGALVGGELAASSPVAMSPELALVVASELEGHPDNVAACLLGGFTVSWYDGEVPRAARLDASGDLRPVVFVPDFRQLTSHSRAALPGQVAHADAAANGARAALLGLAMSSRPDLLMAATEDRLHQPFRLPSMPETHDLVKRLRAAGVPAVLSGSGPTVLALPATPDLVDVTLATRADGFDVRVLDVDAEGARIEPVEGLPRPA